MLCRICKGKEVLITLTLSCSVEREKNARKMEDSTKSSLELLNAFLSEARSSVSIQGMAKRQSPLSLDYSQQQ